MCTLFESTIEYLFFWPLCFGVLRIGCIGVHFLKKLYRSFFYSFETQCTIDEIDHELVELWERVMSKMGGGVAIALRASFLHQGERSEKSKALQEAAAKIYQGRPRDQENGTKCP